METKRLTKEELPLAITEDATFIVLKDGRYYLDFTKEEEYSPWNIFEALADYYHNEPELAQVTILLLAEATTAIKKQAALQMRLEEVKKKKSDD